ncbi:CMP-sialic acid transporter, putative, partial [Leishmania donovani]
MALADEENKHVADVLPHSIPLLCSNVNCLTNSPALLSTSAFAPNTRDVSLAPASVTSPSISSFAVCWLQVSGWCAPHSCAAAACAPTHRSLVVAAGGPPPRDEEKPAACQQRLPRVAELPRSPWAEGAAQTDIKSGAAALPPSPHARIGAATRGCGPLGCAIALHVAPWSWDVSCCAESLTSHD